MQPFSRNRPVWASYVYVYGRLGSGRIRRESAERCREGHSAAVRVKAKPRLRAAAAPALTRPPPECGGLGSAPRGERASGEARSSLAINRCAWTRYRNLASMYFEPPVLLITGPNYAIRWILARTASDPLLKFCECGLTLFAQTTARHSRNIPTRFQEKPETVEG